VTWQLFWEWKTSSTTMALMVSADLKPKKVIVSQAFRVQYSLCFTHLTNHLVFCNLLRVPRYGTRAAMSAL